ncbi:GNAT family N-acetyltransferase [Bacteroidota bacterium]
MNIIPVSNKKTRKEFLDVARHVYRGDDNWVCPLDTEINSIFDPDINPYFTHGEATRWILKDSDGNLTGRIAAFINRKANEKLDTSTGGIGFFECINDEKAASLLFDTGRDWLKERGMEAMDGPINFGETDKYWGLLVDGFTQPSYEIAYNPRYYQDLFENYGFQTYYKQEGFHLDLTKPMPERFTKIASWVAKKPGYEFRHFEWKHAAQQVRDFAEVFNTTWPTFKPDFTPLVPEYIYKTMKKARAIIEEEFAWIAYHDGKPIAIYLMWPDVNQILKHLNGKLHLINKLRFLYLKKKKTMTRARGVLMGVIPKFQGLGVESVIILKLVEVFSRKPHYKEIEFSWVGDFNPKMRKIFLSVGTVSAKHYITYRYLFDRNAEFVRYPIPDIKD